LDSLCWVLTFIEKSGRDFSRRVIVKLSLFLDPFQKAFPITINSIKRALQSFYIGNPLDIADEKKKPGDFKMKKPVLEIKSMLWFIPVLALAFLFLVIAEEGEGTTLTVDDEGNAEYTRIQDAVDVAENGDTIFIYTGEYNESIEIDKFLIFQGENRDNVIVRGDDHETPFIGDFKNNPGSDTSVIKFVNLTVLGNGTECIQLEFYNETWPGYDAVIENCSVVCESPSGKDSGVSLYAGFPIQYGSFSIENCSISGAGVGIELDFNGDADIPVFIENCEIYNNMVSAIDLLGGDKLYTLKLLNSRIYNNSGDENDESLRIHMNVENFHIDACEIHGNQGTGIDLQDVEGFTLTNSQIYSNGENGVSLASVKTINIRNNELRDNIHNGISLEFSSDEKLNVEIINNTFSENEIGLWFEVDINNETILYFENNEFSSNRMGAQFDFEHRGHYLSHDSTIKNNVFINNYNALQITDLYDFSVENCEFLGNDYGLLFDDDNNAVVKHCLFENNGNGMNVTIYKGYSDDIRISFNNFSRNSIGVYLYYAFNDELPEIEIRYNTDFRQGFNSYK